MNVWLAGARPRTLGAGLVPVVVGAATAETFIAWRFVAALIVAAGAPGRRELRERLLRRHPGGGYARPSGPPRLVATGAASPRAVLVAALVSIGAAGFAGLALALATEPVLILFVGAIALVAAFAYSGGPRPYAGLGLGEVMVFVFFGLMATAGTAFVMDERVPAAAWWCGAVLGLLAVAILVANNLRDIPTDAATGKRTLAVRLGDRRTRLLYRACVVGAFGTIAIGALIHAIRPSVGLTPWALLGLVAWIPAIRPMELVGSASGRDLIRVLTGTAAVHAACGLLIAVGLILGRTVGPLDIRIGT